MFYTIAAITFEALGAGAAGMLGLVAVTAASLKFFKNGKSHPTPEERLAAMDTKLDTVAERVSEMHGTVKMLPCVKPTGACHKL